MKISLNIDGTNGQSDKSAQSRALERLIIDAKKGDFESKELLAQKFRPLMVSLAEKRTKDPVLFNKYMEAAREGLLAAAGKYSPSVGPNGFQLFALDFIEANLDRVGKGGGFFARLFGK